MGNDEPADSLAEILTTFSAEHRHVASLLEALEREAAKLESGKVPNY